MSRAPWDFSTPIDLTNVTNAVPNLPCEDGAALGKELARLARPCIERDRVRFPNGLPPCDECAFVEGTVPNRTASTLMDAVKCMIEGEPFYCHKGVPVDGEPKRMCSGWFALNGPED